jgi:hypothetical protein
VGLGWGNRARGERRIGCVCSAAGGAAEAVRADSASLEDCRVRAAELRAFPSTSGWGGGVGCLAQCGAARPGGGVGVGAARRGMLRSRGCARTPATAWDAFSWCIASCTCVQVCLGRSDRRVVSLRARGAVRCGAVRCGAVRCDSVGAVRCGVVARLRARPRRRLGCIPLVRSSLYLCSGSPGCLGKAVTFAFVTKSTSGEYSVSDKALG